MKIDLHNYEAFLLDHSEGRLDVETARELKLFLLAHPELEIDLEDIALIYVNGEDEPANFKASLKKDENSLADETLLNYLEENLSAGERVLFERKLAWDPELAKDLEEYKKTILSADQEIVFESKEKLIKTEEELLLNDQLLAYVEKQLSATEKRELEARLFSEPQLQNELKLFSKTILTADASVVYPDKAALKKEAKVIRLFTLRTMGSVAAALLLLFGLTLIYQYAFPGKSVKTTLASQSTPANSAVKITDTKKAVELPAVKPKEGNSQKIIKTPESTKVPAAQLVKGSAEETPSTPTPEPITDRERVQLAVQDPSKEEPVKNRDTINITKKQIDLAIHNKEESRGDSSFNVQNYLPVAGEFETELGSDKSTDQKGFWKKAVHLAKQANKLGVKSIDGQEDSKNKYRVSFNAFSVEKK